MLTWILIIDILGALVPLAVFIVGSRGLYNRQKSIQKMMKNNAQIQKEQ